MQGTPEVGLYYVVYKMYGGIKLKVHSTKPGLVN